MTIDIRATEPDEYRAAATAFIIPLMEAPPDDEAWERSRPTWEIAPSYSAWDGDRCVGHAAQFLVDTTVPGGGRLPTGAVTRVGVLPTYRRRGVATGLMNALLADAVDRDLALMSLRASEAVIYRRYGYGVAGDFCEVAIDSRRTRPVRGAETDGSFRLLDPNELVDVIPPLYERVAHRRPGIITRPDAWWPRTLRDAIAQTKASFVAVHVDVEGEPDGYVHYETKWDHNSFAESSGEGKVHDLFGVDDAVELALWQYLFDLDLVTRWTASERPADDLVRLATHDRRAYRQTSIGDEQWLRLVDVDRALAARAYNAATGEVTIGVHDPVLADNCGTWRVSSEGVERTEDDPDLAVTIETISAAYLGGPSWAALAGVGAVEVRDPAAIALADTLFASRPLPFCGSFF
jgi:predicted acetyltransferase